MTFTYQWQRCDAGGGSCTPIADATGPNDTLTPDDIGALRRRGRHRDQRRGTRSTAGPVSPVVAAAGAVQFADDFTGPDGVVTNQYAFDNRNRPDAILSPDWEATSGSLFRRGGSAWTGVPDDVAPDATSSTGNASAVFRLRTVRSDFGNVAVSFSLLNNGLVSTP